MGTLRYRYPGETPLIGGTIGALAGGGLGYLSGGKKNKLLSTILGTGIGAGTGYLADKYNLGYKIDKYLHDFSLGSPLTRGGMGALVGSGLGYLLGKDDNKLLPTLIGAGIGGSTGYLTDNLGHSIRLLRRGIFDNETIPYTSGGIGALVGSGLGYLLGKDDNKLLSTLIGTGIGTGIGAGAGFLANKYGLPEFLNTPT